MSVGIGSVKRGGFIYSVRCVQRYLVKAAPTALKTLAQLMLKDTILRLNQLKWTIHTSQTQAMMNYEWGS
ncbi:MAG TPA: hypothetical protein DCY88_09395 [Cyanobacteria bacterium UBA11372]|nr:hypothetical protein [Cyanobacteria bacterium UBA11372]